MRWHSSFISLSARAWKCPLSTEMVLCCAFAELKAFGSASAREIFQRFCDAKMSRTKQNKFLSKLLRLGNGSTNTHDFIIDRALREIQ
jgi:hypothetical protein